MLALLTMLALLAGCATLPPADSAPGAATASPLGTPFSDDRYAGRSSAPLVIERGDRGLGTTVTFERLPTPAEMHDAALVSGLAHVVVALPGWPNDYAPLEGLKLAPEGIDVMVILPGYPPSRGAAELWNLLGAPVRIVLLVNGPPADSGVLHDLNTMRNLERVIAEMDEPSRGGFERLQRPLSFRKIVR
jgi:hypothetical protein